MFLPIRLAAVAPVTVAILVGLIIGLAAPEGRKLHPIYGMPQGAYLAFFAGIPALLFVLPNIVAAAAAHRLSGGAPLPFTAILVSVFALAFWAEALFLNRAFRGLGGKFLSLTDWRLHAMLLVNLGILLVIAVWRARSEGA